MFTREHYVAIADVISYMSNAVDRTYTSTMFSVMLANDNENFKPEVFKKACNA